MKEGNKEESTSARLPLRYKAGKNKRKLEKVWKFLYNIYRK